MATLNVSQKINGPVAAQVQLSSGTSLFYTAPSDGYAIINVGLQGNTGGLNTRVEVGDVSIYDDNVSGGSTPSPASGVPYVVKQGVYVGPGQSVRFTNVSGGFPALCRIRGVEFRNTQ